MKKRLISLLFAIALVLGAIAPAVMADDTIKIGAIGVLSGPAAMYGIGVQNGVNLYVKQLNEAGGIDGKKVEVIWEDSEGNPTVGTHAFNKLVENEGVVAILGPVITPVTRTVAELSSEVGEYGIPVITPSATAYDITTDRPNVFRTCFLDPFQAYATANYAKDEGIEKVAIIYDNGDEYSTGLYEAFRDQCEQVGIEIVATESAAFTDVDFKSQLANIMNAEPQAVFLPYYGAPAAYILSQANELGFETRFFGNDGLSSLPGTISDTKLLTSVTYSDHFTTEADYEKAVEFVKAYEDEYGRKPEISFCATGYDAALVLCEGIKIAGSTDSKAVIDAIKGISVEGVSGNITFDDHNDPIKTAYFLTFDAEGNSIFLKAQEP